MPLGVGTGTHSPEASVVPAGGHAWFTALAACPAPPGQDPLALLTAPHWHPHGFAQSDRGGHTGYNGRATDAPPSLARPHLYAPMIRYPPGDRGIWQTSQNLITLATLADRFQM